jgi:hypothetical protein
MSSYIIKHFISEWRREWVMQIGIVQLPEIYADLDLSCLLVLYHHRANPF